MSERDAKKDPNAEEAKEVLEANVTVTEKAEEVNKDGKRR